jgi:outer membrane lipoprotein SlyB
MRASVMLLPALLLLISAAGCATVPAAPYPEGNWVLYGQVESIYQRPQYAQGDPASGAVAGAVIGGFLGTALGGRGFGTLMGATHGAMIGAHSSRGGYVGTAFDVHVRFQDGSLRTFVFNNQLPFRQGEYVVWTPQGLARHGG